MLGGTAIAGKVLVVILGRGLRFVLGITGVNPKVLTPPTLPRVPAALLREKTEDANE
jgi:hypothetical protein